VRASAAVFLVDSCGGALLFKFVTYTAFTLYALVRYYHYLVGLHGACVSIALAEAEALLDHTPRPRRPGPIQNAGSFSHKRSGARARKERLLYNARALTDRFIDLCGSLDSNSATLNVDSSADDDDSNAASSNLHIPESASELPIAQIDTNSSSSSFGEGVAQIFDHFRKSKEFPSDEPGGSV
jgi:hypothetical protein